MTPDGEPGLNYLCAGYKAFFTHVDRPMRLMADLLRRGRYAGEAMGLLAAEATRLREAAARAGRNDPAQLDRLPVAPEEAGRAGRHSPHDATEPWAGRGHRVRRRYGRVSHPGLGHYDHDHVFCERAARRERSSGDRVELDLAGATEEGLDECWPSARTDGAIG